MFINYFLTKAQNRFMILLVIKSLVCILMFSLAEEVEVKTTITAHYHAAYITYATAHNKEFLVNTISMLSIDFL